MMGCQTTKKKHRKNLGKKRREEKRREEKRERRFYTSSLSCLFTLSFPLFLFLSLLSLSLINFLSPSRNQGELLLLLW